MLKKYLLLILLITNTAIADGLVLPMAEDFFIDSQKSRKNIIPILIMFSVPGCGYCKKIKEEVLSPMAKLEEYSNKIIIRHVDSSSNEVINNFFNEEVSQSDFSFNYAINLFPTVVLVDNYGVILDKIIGVIVEDYYWMFLDEAIESSTYKLKQQLNADI
jgi:thioredoxin-related protein